MLGRWLWEGVVPSAPGVGERAPTPMHPGRSHVCCVTPHSPPTEGHLLSSQIRRWLDGNQAPAGACCNASAGATAVCTGVASGPRVLSCH